MNINSGKSKKFVNFFIRDVRNNAAEEKTRVAGTLLTICRAGS